MISLSTDIADKILLDSLNSSQYGIGKSLERLTSGFKLNHAADNAAGISIVTNLNSKISSLLQVQDNTKDGVSLLSTAQGALENIQDKLARLRELATQAANGTYGDRSLAALQEEADAIIAQIKQIRENTEFNGMKLFYKPNENTAKTALQRLSNAKISIPGTNSRSQYSAAVQNTDAAAVSLYDITSGNIEGSVDFKGGETKTISIDGVNYTVKNRLASAQGLSYTKDASTGELTFLGNNFTITGQKDVAHNLIINGSRNWVYTGNLDDKVLLQGYSNVVRAYDGNDEVTVTKSYSSNEIHLGEGDDTCNLYGGYSVVYGEGGNDTFNINNSGSSGVYGGDGDDIFNVSKGSTNNRLHGQNGDDTFNIEGNGNYIYGGEGDNSITDTGSNNTKFDVPGASGSSFELAANETKTITIDGKEYTFKAPGSLRVVAYELDTNGAIHFYTSSSITITAQKDVAHNVVLPTQAIFYGGDKGDTIVCTGNQNTIYAGEGDNNITMGTYSSLFAGNGNNTIKFNTMGYNVTILGDGNNDITIGASSYDSSISLGNGNNNISLTYSAEKCSFAAGSGTNTLSLNGSARFEDCLISGFQDSVNNATTIALDPKYNVEKSLTLNGKEYKLSKGPNNNNTFKQNVNYSVNDITGEVSFGGGRFQITSQKDVSHNVSIYGKYVWYYGGDEADTIKNYAGYGYIYGGGGDDDIISYAGSSAIYGDDGNDSITIYSSATVNGGAGDDTITINYANKGYIVNGGDGDDTYYLNKAAEVTETGGNNIFYINADNCDITAAEGDDTFYISSNNNKILGAGGDDYFVIDGNNNTIDGGTGSNYYVDNGTGNIRTNLATDPNSGKLIFNAQDEVLTFTVGNKTYTVKNNFAGKNELSYYYNANTKVITLVGSNLLIDSIANQANNLYLRGSNNILNGSDLADRITIEQGSDNVINGLGGNDTLIMNSENNSLLGGDGDDTIILNASTDKEVSGGAGSDIFNIISGNNTNINGGEGNNIFNVSGEQNVIDMGNGNNKINLKAGSNQITAGNGNNDFLITSDSNIVTAGSGDNSLALEGDSNKVTVDKISGKINIYGDSNTITNTAGENEVTIKGSGNSYTAENGDNKVSLIGNSNNLTTGAGKDSVTVRGDKNTVKTGDGDDDFLVGKGNSNVLDGEGGRNTLIDNGKNTQFNNIVDITPRPFEFEIKVGVGNGASKVIKSSISFNLYDFAVDLSSREGALEALSAIDDLMNTVSDQLVNIGTSISKLEFALDEQSILFQNLVSTRSTLRDTDVAEESSNLIKYQILQQASATLISSTRNIRAENVLGLLQGL